MRHVILVGLATVMVFGCSHVGSLDGDAGTDTETDTDVDTDTIDCNKGDYNGDFEIDTQTDVANLAGYTSISGKLKIDCPSCTDLSELICLTSVGGTFSISSNDTLANIDGLSSLTSVGWGLHISFNEAMSDCEACDLLDQLTSGPTVIDVEYNLDDSCTPVPANCL